MIKDGESVMEAILTLLMIAGVIYFLYIYQENARLKGELNYKIMQEKVILYRRQLKKMDKNTIFSELYDITHSEKFENLWKKAIKLFNDNNREIKVCSIEDYKQKCELYKNSDIRILCDTDEDASESIYQYMAMIDMEYTCRYLAFLDLNKIEFRD